MKTLSRFLMAILLTCGVLFIAGCNTVKGFGQDMQAGGQAVEKAANDNSSSKSSTSTSEPA